MKKIYIILLIALTARLFHINYPVCGWHSWRQADTAAIARNFYESGNNILYPQIDWRGNTEGYVETEFQIYPYAISLLYKIFGVHDYIGRIVSVVFSLLTVFGLYKLVLKILGEKTAFWSALVFSLLPLNVYFTRVFMPESLLLLCSVYSILFFLKWIQEDKYIYYFLTVIFTALACLVKLPTLYIGLPLAFLAYTKYGIKMFINPRIILMTLLVLGSTGLWYYHAHNLYKTTGLTFSIWNIGEDKWGRYDYLFTLSFYNDIFFKSIAERHLTYLIFILCIWGLFIKRTVKLEYLFDFYLIAFLFFIFLAPQAHLAQEYYQLPIGIACAVFAGKVLAKYLIPINSLKSVKKQLSLALVVMLLAVLFPILSFLRNANFWKSEDLNSPFFVFTGKVKQLTEKNDKIISVSDGNPVFLYNMDRKGWITTSENINTKYLEEMKNKGARYLAGEKKYFKNSEQQLEYLLTNYNRVFNDDNCFIVSLDR